MLMVGLVAVAVLAFVQQSQLSDERVRGEAVMLAERFIDAHNSRDHETARALVADTAIISMNPARSVDQLEMEIAWLDATGWYFTTEGCTATRGPTTLGEIHVLCHLVHENAWSRALGLDPDTRSALTLDIVSGKITSALLSFAPISFPTESVLTFDTWIRDTYPDDHEVMYQYAGLPDLTQESIDLWQAHTNQFVAERIR